MKILYDHQVYTWQKYGGISRYFTQIISNLPTDIETEIGIRYSDNEYLKKAGLVNDLKPLFQPIDHYVSDFNGFMYGTKFPGKKKIFSLLKQKKVDDYPDAYEQNKKVTIDLLEKQDFDIFHPTYYDDYFLDYLGGKPFVLTIHDMIHEIYPEMMNDPETSEKKSILATKANHIIAVSNNTKKDIIDILGISPNKISVVYHASSLINSDLKYIDIPAKFILFVGERHIYKNFLFFARSIESILKKDLKLFVVCVGRNFNAVEHELLSSLGILQQFIAKSCNDEELDFLYKKAIALVFPSYYEGFGIPIIEAFEAGCPVVLSNTSCFQEIAQDAAIYFNPKNKIEIEKSIKRVLFDKSLRSELIEKGISKARSFSWKISANKTAEVYKCVCKNGRIE